MTLTDTTWTDLTADEQRPRDGEPVAAEVLDSIERSLCRGDLTSALGLVRSIRRRARRSDRHRALDHHRLTDREVTTLMLLSDATLSQKDMARTLGITHNTLKTHLRSLYQKLDAHSRAEAIERGFEGRFSSRTESWA